ncbi:DUF4214 domain-containing protein [Massilia sp. CCM 9210]|uniref:DUF4214 domain-containing protein n=1 Tax=Massilia scottii TaxID=3057166 RepID=UPI0027969604|nr:DUF4214 domain-containing protein [Massilia sp. CCM 9210]MDQ1813421.1 DUF4214 domain-containing protein [Massilia sp. CCM 9210]
MYQLSSSATTTTLMNLNSTLFTQGTIDRILALTASVDKLVSFDTVTPNAGGKLPVSATSEVLLVATSDTAQTTIVGGDSAPVTIFQGKGGVNARFEDARPTDLPYTVPERIVVGTNGTDKFVIADDRNTQLSLGSGNSVVSSIGTSYDTIVAGLGNSTIVGGNSGNAIVQLKGNASDYKVTVQDGHAIVTNLGTLKTTDISKLQFVQLDGGQALVFASDAKEASVSTLYSAALGRTPDAKGLEFWMDAVRSGVSLESIAQGFLDSSEYKAKPQLSDQQFLDGLYLRTFNRAPDAEGLAYWNNVLDSGVSRASVLAGFISVAGNSLDGTGNYIEPVVVGSVTIVHNIV